MKNIDYRDMLGRFHRAWARLHRRRRCDWSDVKIERDASLRAWDIDCRGCRLRQRIDEDCVEDNDIVIRELERLWAIEAREKSRLDGSYRKRGPSISCEGDWDP